MNAQKTFRTYYELTKPGIIYGNLLTTIAGFLFASGLERVFAPRLFVATIIGTAFVIGSACVFNNYIDRNIDRKMERTKKRGTVTGEVGGGAALAYGTILGLIGFATLFLYVNSLVGWLETFAFISYVVFYGLAKRHTIYGVLVGSIPGALPIVAGYAAVTGRVDLAGYLLLIIMVLWQMPHFYGIALHRAKEYRQAGLPILPLERGVLRTKIEMLAYTLLFFVAVLLLTLFNYTGYIYLGVMAVVAAGWVLLAATGFRDEMKNDAVGKWGRTMFLYSLAVITVFSVMASIGAIIR